MVETVDVVDFEQTRNVAVFTQISSKEFLSRQQLFKRENSNPKTVSINFTEINEHDVVVKDQTSAEKGQELASGTKKKTIEHD